MLVTLLLFLVLSGCQDVASTNFGTPACSVTQGSSGVTVNCPDHSDVFIPNGVNGVNGVDGTNGANGVAGQTGNTGAQGPVGLQGLPGTSVLPVQFCPGFVPQYPTNFPEYGLRIGTQLFGVYWSGSTAFLALLTPGAYVSTSLSNTVCSFTVNVDGTVSQ